MIWLFSMFIVHHCFACMFTAAIKTDESHHALQKDQGNHIYQWNTLIFSPCQQETQEENHQESKLLDTVVLPGTRAWRSLGACWRSLGPRWWQRLTSCHIWRRATWWNWQHQCQFNWHLNPEIISMFLNKYIFFPPGENLPSSAALGFTYMRLPDMGCWNAVTQ